MNFYSQFNKLKWGFIFILINIPISFGRVKIDIMPDIVGYILFALALNDLSSYDYNFDSAKKYNIAEIALSIIMFITNEISVLNVIVSIVNFVVALAFIYNIFMGVKGLADRFKAPPRIGYTADDLWNKYKWFVGISMVSVFFVFILGPLALILTAGILIYGIYMIISIVGLMNDCAESIFNNEA